jgi:hypothetical protein
MSKNIKKPLNHFIFPNISTRNVAPIDIAAKLDSYEKAIENICHKIDPPAIIPTNRIKRIFGNQKINELSILKAKTIISSNITIESPTVDDYTSTKETIKLKIKPKLILNELNISQESVITEGDNLFPTQLKNYKIKVPKIKLNEVYKSFNEISGHQKQLTTKVNKTVNEINKSIYQINNKDLIEQNEIFGGIQRVKMFDMNENVKREFGLQINKNKVLKEYKMINIVKKDFAKLIYKKYIKTDQYNLSARKDKFKINHKKIVDLIDNIRKKRSNY